MRLNFAPFRCDPILRSVGIARAKNGDLTSAGEKFCEMLRKASKVANSRTTKAVEQNTYRERG